MVPAPNAGLAVFPFTMVMAGALKRGEAEKSKERLFNARNVAFSVL